MTENEIIKELENCYGTMSTYIGNSEDCRKRNEAISRAINAVNEVEQYRLIGTVDECRIAMRKQKAQKPYVWGDGYDGNGNIVYDMYTCPSCGKGYEVDYDHYEYCPKCGQHMERG